MEIGIVGLVQTPGLQYESETMGPSDSTTSQFIDNRSMG